MDIPARPLACQWPSHFYKCPASELPNIIRGTRRAAQKRRLRVQEPPRLLSSHCTHDTARLSAEGSGDGTQRVPRGECRGKSQQFICGDFMRFHGVPDGPRARWGYSVPGAFRFLFTLKRNRRAAVQAAKPMSRCEHADDMAFQAVLVQTLGYKVPPAAGRISQFSRIGPHLRRTDFIAAPPLMARGACRGRLAVPGRKTRRFPVDIICIDKLPACIYNKNILFALHYIPTRDARSTVQTEQAMPFGAWGRVALQAAADGLRHICGTVVCSAGVYFYTLRVVRVTEMRPCGGIAAVAAVRIPDGTADFWNGVP